MKIIKKVERGIDEEYNRTFWSGIFTTGIRNSNDYADFFTGLGDRSLQSDCFCLYEQYMRIRRMHETDFGSLWKISS